MIVNIMIFLAGMIVGILLRSIYFKIKSRMNQKIKKQMEE